MRIIAGAHASRQFMAPKGQRMRPMADRVRGALFSILGDIEGLSFFDAYGGSGALAFEASSRGAKSVQITEKDRRTFELIQKNIKQLGLKNVKATRASCTGYLSHNPSVFYDVIIADPPFDELNRQKLNELAGFLKESGLLVVSHSGSEKSPKLKLSLVDSKNYGDAALAFYRQIK